MALMSMGGVTGVFNRRGGRVRRAVGRVIGGNLFGRMSGSACSVSPFLGLRMEMRRTVERKGKGVSVGGVCCRVANIRIL